MSKGLTSMDLAGTMPIMRPSSPPVGLQLNRAARIVGRAFDHALAEVGGSLPVWLALLNLKANPGGSQREIAEAIGVSEATLTHHLNALDTEGVVIRRRDPDNRRVHVLELTEKGEELFGSLRSAAMAFDRRLRRGVSDEEIASLKGLLDRLAGNVATEAEEASPWAGLVGKEP